ncbi:MAG: hypothetical protein ABI369_05310 [Acetobacteraceae bacterium]
MIVGAIVGAASTVATAVLKGQSLGTRDAILAALVGGIIAWAACLAYHFWLAPAALAADEGKRLGLAYSGAIHENAELQRRLPSPAYNALNACLILVTEKYFHTPMDSVGIAEWKKSVSPLTAAMPARLTPLLQPHEIHRLNVVPQTRGHVASDWDDEHSELKSALLARMEVLRALLEHYSPVRDPMATRPPVSFRPSSPESLLPSKHDQ